MQILWNALSKLVLTVVLTMAVLSCKKAGTGGEAEVTVTVAHHEKPVPGAKVMVKFNSEEFPGSGATYDLIETCGVTGHGKGHCHIKQLRHGSYYFYAEGYDSSILQKVTGGLAVKIARSDRKKKLDAHVPVTE